MSNKYIYDGDDSPQLVSREPLPEGDYRFTVSEFTEPYLKDNGRWVCKVKLTILKDDKQPGGAWVWAHPWSGETNAGKKRDGIGQFLQCINCAPKKGQAPEWDNVIGTNGRCHLRIKDDDYGRNNEVAYFITPKPLDLAPENRMTIPRKEYVKMTEPEPDEEDDIKPF